ncbi:hypothetical protein [Deinococcus hopiensis]|uniref:Uncharacterized protein n=1 Tax=Deinococcus hopiensis KR-140 TaxID=695939 RepID=A0A1W1UUG4_9DEIO|nr:hypothetical protein [Deinococcus hopiensis]SMB84676.1 hypothetical protein SAMN00790413_05236 [Deinococcus hopiensis KR-140]
MTLAPSRPQEVAVSKFKTEDLIVAALQTPTQKAAQRQAEEARAATAKQRAGRKKLTPRQTIQALTSGRTQAREARQYAERWYQALRGWDVREVEIPYSFHYEPSEDGPEFLTLGSNTPMPTRYLQTSAGEFTEGEVGTLITTMSRSPVPEQKQLGKMLDKPRHERQVCMASLVREGGRWKRHRERAVSYAIAVLTLAVQLRDEPAEHPPPRDARRAAEID